jgi:phosphoribosylamine--glycine ligase
MGVGGGAREHALAWKLSQSGHEPQIFWIAENRNPGIHDICRRTRGELRLGGTTDSAFVTRRAMEWKIDMAVVGPEEPNFRGIPDALENQGIPCIGASRELARIEMSKAELRRLQWKHGLPGKLLFRTFRDSEEAVEVLQKYSNTLTWLQNVALKPARQAGGRGVKVIDDRQIYLHDEKEQFKEAHIHWLHDYMAPYSDIEDKILVEEKVWGPEYTLQCFTDGHTVTGTPLVQDNKNAHEFDIGSETGGMGSISGPDMMLPFITQEEYDRSLKIVEGIVGAIQEETGKRYHGFVAGQMMLTEVEGPTIIEMYSRLGDPETLNILTMMQTDLVDVFEAIIDERLSKIKLEFDNKAVVAKAFAPNGYPDKREQAKGHPLKFTRSNCQLFWGSAELKDDGSIITGGSRVLDLVATGATLPEASAKIEEAAAFIKLEDGWGLYHRTDIGTEALLAKRVEVAERVRRLYKYREERGTLGRRTDWLPKIGRIDPAEALLSELRRAGDA